MREAARAPSVVWGAGLYTLLVVPVAFTDVAERLPASWGPRMIGEVDAYFREVSGGAVRWRFGGQRRVRLPRRSSGYHLRRRTLGDRVRFWAHLLGRLRHVPADALLVVLPEEAALRGCFAVGPRWNSPRLSAALGQIAGPTVRGAVVRGSTSWGTVAHELGHVLGLPDLYDYWLGRRNTDLSASPYVGAWDLMGRSSEGAEGARPHPMAWTRSLANWITPREWHPRESQYFVGGRGAAAVRVPMADGTSLYVEARQRTGFDAVLPSEGVLLSVADERRAEGRGPLRVIDPSRSREPDHEAHLGAHWNAALQPGERLARAGIAVAVVAPHADGYQVEITPA